MTTLFLTSVITSFSILFYGVGRIWTHNILDATQLLCHWATTPLLRVRWESRTLIYRFTNDNSSLKLTEPFFYIFLLRVLTSISITGSISVGLMYSFCKILEEWMYERMIYRNQCYILRRNQYLMVLIASADILTLRRVINIMTGGFCQTNSSHSNNNNSS